jgi:diguanylate cyclase (GGDEF)-like protein
LTDLQTVIARARAHEDLSGRAAPCEIVEIDRLRADFHALLDQLKSREADLRRTHGVLKRLATSDRLTGLANRAMLEARLLALTGGERRVPARLGVLYFDVDSFKAVNDALGHSVGDALLKAIAGRLRENLPPEALPARIGGDEFVVLFASLTSEGELEHQAVAAQERLEAPLQLGEVLFHTAVSVGWTAVPAEGAEAAKLLELADQAMYAAKATRRDAGRRTRWTRKEVTTITADGPQQQLSQSDQLVLARLARETASP